MLYSNGLFQKMCLIKPYGFLQLHAPLERVELRQQEDLQLVLGSGGFCTDKLWFECATKDAGSGSLVFIWHFCVDVHTCGIWVYADVCVCTCVCEYIYSSTCVWMEARGRYQVSSLVAIPTFWDKVSHSTGSTPVCLDWRDGEPWGCVSRVLGL